MSKLFYFIGRDDGIGNRIEELIGIQEYCEMNNMNCVYIWNNSFVRNYEVGISFHYIEIRNKLTETDKKYIRKQNCMMRSLNYIVKYKFNFVIDYNIAYDIIIHIRGTDRISTSNKHHDFSTQEMLYSYIEKTINYVNNQQSIRTYTIVTDDNKYIEYVKPRINKQYVQLLYDRNINNDWVDFYYLTKPNKYVLMCCQFSSYSICASILGRKPLLVFQNSLKSNLSRYNANIRVID